MMMTQDERDSAVWKKHTAFLRERLTNLGQALERRNLAATDAEYYRGQIALIREILFEEEEP